MAIKKRKKIKNKKVRVEKSSASPPEESPGKNNSENTESTKSDSGSKPQEKKESVNAQNTATKEPSPKPPPASKKETEKGLTGIAAYIEFLKQVRIEYRKINWPDRRQIIQETWTVLVLVTFITLLVLGYDWVLGNLVFGPLEHWIKINIGP